MRLNKTSDLQMHNRLKVSFPHLLDHEINQKPKKRRYFKAFLVRRSSGKFQSRFV